MPSLALLVVCVIVVVFDGHKPAFAEIVPAREQRGVAGSPCPDTKDAPHHVKPHSGLIARRNSDGEFPSPVRAGPELFHRAVIRLETFAGAAHVVFNNRLIIGTLHGQRSLAPIPHAEEAISDVGCGRSNVADLSGAREFVSGGKGAWTLATRIDDHDVPDAQLWRIAEERLSLHFPSLLGCRSGGGLRIHGSPPGEEGCGNKNEKAYQSGVELRLRNLCGPLRRVSHSDLLTKVIIIGGSVFAIFGLAAFAGWSSPKRPKISLAMLAGALFGLWIFLSEFAKPCTVHVDHEQGEADRERYSSDNRKV